MLSIKTQVIILANYEKKKLTAKRHYFIRILMTFFAICEK